MREKLRFLGLDVHAETIAVAVAEPDGEGRGLGTIANREDSIRKFIRKLGPPEHLRACYEAVTKLIAQTRHIAVVTSELPANLSGIRTQCPLAERISLISPIDHRSYRNADVHAPARLSRVSS